MIENGRCEKNKDEDGHWVFWPVQECEWRSRAQMTQAVVEELVEREQLFPFKLGFFD